MPCQTEFNSNAILPSKEAKDHYLSSISKASDTTKTMLKSQRSCCNFSIAVPAPVPITVPVPVPVPAVFSISIMIVITVTIFCIISLSTSTPTPVPAISFSVLATLPIIPIPSSVSTSLSPISFYHACNNFYTKKKKKNVEQHMNENYS